MINDNYRYTGAIKDGSPISISDLNQSEEDQKTNRGLRCGCVCSACGSPLMARMGKIKKHHFAHHAGGDCEWGMETDLHYLAKKIISQSKTFIAPPFVKTIFLDGDPRYSKNIYIEENKIHVDNVYLEKRIFTIRPDIIIQYEGKELLVEIAVTHFIDEEKKRKIMALGIPTIEIDLSRMSHNEIAENLTSILIENSSYKKWIYCPGLDIEKEYAELEKQKESDQIRHLEDEQRKGDAEAHRQAELEKQNVARREEDARIVASIKREKQKREDNQIVFVTGRAGTGKTHLLKYINQMIFDSDDDPDFSKAIDMISMNSEVVVLAQSGVAAINAGGMTINKFFPFDYKTIMSADDLFPNIYEKLKYNKKRIDLINKIDVLIIDEISFVKSGTLDIIDTIMQVYRGNKNPFGGAQVVLFGDVFQLPPIEDRINGNKYNPAGYESLNFFHSKAFVSAYKNKKIRCVELKKIRRQTEADFITLLNKVRIGLMDDADIEFINKKFNPKIENREGWITITTHNSRCQEINESEIAKLDSEQKIYIADADSKIKENDYPASSKIELRVGVQIMVIKNLGNGMYNGQLAKVVSLHDGKIIVESDFGIKEIEWETWEVFNYAVDEKTNKITKELIGVFIQMPVQVAYAITVHKSQGLQFNNAILDVGNSFSYGQVYVALSRCRRIDGVMLENKINKECIKKIPSQIIKFSKWAESQAI